VKYNSVTGKIDNDQEVNEYAMRYGFYPGQLYPADWDISPDG